MGSRCSNWCANRTARPPRSPRAPRRRVEQARRITCSQVANSFFLVQRPWAYPHFSIGRNRISRNIRKQRSTFHARRCSSLIFDIEFGSRRWSSADHAEQIVSDCRVVCVGKRPRLAGGRHIASWHRVCFIGSLMRLGAACRISRARRGRFLSRF